MYAFIVKYILDEVCRIRFLYTDEQNVASRFYIYTISCYNICVENNCVS